MRWRRELAYKSSEPSCTNAGFSADKARSCKGEAPQERRPTQKNLVFDEDAGAFGLFAGVLFFDFVEGTEAFGFEAALWKGRFAGAWIVEADEEDADFAFFALEADADGHLADDINDAGFGKCDVKFFDAERKFIIDANDFRTNCHVRRKIYGGVDLARGTRQASENEGA